MTENFYRAENYNVDYASFGGKIYESDFNSKRTMSDIIGRIISDRKFDEKYKRMATNREIHKSVPNVWTKRRIIEWIS